MKDFKKVVVLLFVVGSMFALTVSSFAFTGEPQKDDMTVKVQKLDKLFGKIKFYGDYRGRWEGTETKETVSDTSVDKIHWRNRYRYRLRMGLKAKINDEIDFISRIAGGGGRTSTNQTFTGGFVNDAWGVDMVYFKYRPRWIKDWATIQIGKMKNPLYSTQMIWDSDLTPEGAVFKGNWKNVLGSKWSVYSDVAGFVFNESATRNQDGWVFTGGGGLYGNIAGLVDLKVGGNYYSWIHPEQVATNLWTTSTMTGGNITLGDSTPAGWVNVPLSRFNVGEIRGDLKFSVLEHPVILTGSYITNGGARSDTNTGKKWSDGIYGKVKFGKMTKKGKNKKMGDWWASWMYYDLAPDATPAAFPDADLRGTNTKAHELELEYMFLPNTTIGGTAHFIRPHVKYNPLSGAELRDRNLYFIDVITKF